MANSSLISFEEIKNNFYNNTKMEDGRGDEDNIKINTYSFILSPLIQTFLKGLIFDSETTYIKGGRSDGTIGALVFEYKKSNYFKNEKGIKEAIFGRKNGKNDSGLYQYLIDHVNAESKQIDDSILKTTGIGFDGFKWIFARFVPSIKKHKLNLSLTRFSDDENEYPYELEYKIYDFDEGLKYLSVLFKSMDKIPLTKDNLTDVLNPSSSLVRTDLLSLYKVLQKELKDGEFFNKRVKTLYEEWLLTFGKMFGEEDNSTEFNETSSSIINLYHFGSDKLDSKIFLFTLQTYFNIVLKLLVSNFLTQAKSPIVNIKEHMSFSEMAALFEGQGSSETNLVKNFFEVHYYEWFTFVNSGLDADDIVVVINNVIDMIADFDMGTFNIMPENIHDILQEVYMGLIPDKVRHLLGEYFSPDWIVEYCLDEVGYSKENFGPELVNKKIIDPTAGSGAFVIQAVKRSINATRDHNTGKITFQNAKKITENVVGFDLNPISSISAKANYIFALFSNLDVSDVKEPLNIPIYITDSVLAPIVYSEENEKNFIAKTSVGDFIVPKFATFDEANIFMDELSASIDKARGFNIFWELLNQKIHISEDNKQITENLYEKLTILHRSAQDSFWPKILKNSFAPVILKQKFDFVVGNPPWIAWKSMSKTYREGTLEVWKSYGIFEKSAYDKKTTHDDFAMAVTYVALDQYLKNHGKLIFLLPRTFIKSSKGGQGFRKFKITRNGQEIPLKVISVSDFNDIKIFKPKHTTSTMAIQIEKGKETKFPFDNWKSLLYKDKVKVDFDAHESLAHVAKSIKIDNLIAKPIDSSDDTSPWMTLKSADLQFADSVLANGTDQYYKARKGIEPAGAKGIFIIQEPVPQSGGNLKIVNDMSRQRRKDLKDQGEQAGIVEADYIYPMLGGRNIQRWKVVSNEYIIVPHDSNNIYGIPELELVKKSPKLYHWLEYYKSGLLASRIQSGKFFNPDIHPWYRLDNVGKYTYSRYKVLWKEQAKSFAAVAVGSFKDTFGKNNLDLIGGVDKPLVVDSKVLMLNTESFEEALYVTGILNAPSVRNVIDSYAVQLNRGIDVLRNIKIPKYDSSDNKMEKIVEDARDIQNNINKMDDQGIEAAEQKLDRHVKDLFS